MAEHERTSVPGRLDGWAFSKRTDLDARKILLRGQALAFGEHENSIWGSTLMPDIG